MSFEGFQTIPKFTSSTRVTLGYTGSDPPVADSPVTAALPASRIFGSVVGRHSMGVVFMVGDSTISGDTPAVFLQNGFSGIFNVAGHTHYKVAIPTTRRTSEDTTTVMYGLPVFISISGLAT